ncbi:MAG: helix-turn-helix domain-containing protein [Trebonia sp.]
MTASTAVTIDPAQVEREPLPPGDLRLPSWAAAALEFINKAGEAGEVVSLNAQEPTLTPAQMAAEIGLSRASIQRRIVSGEITCRRVGSRYRIPLREVERFRKAFVRDLAATLANDF